MDFESKVKVLFHSSIRIEDDVTVYIDPYNIKENLNDADYIFITHEHYDHFSPEDIMKIIKNDTIIISVPSVIKKSEDIQPESEKRIAVRPNEKYELKDLNFETTVAYNRLKPFHPKGKEWVGYIITLNGISYYIAGDTDELEDLKRIKCDVALVPVGGTYTMNYKEAANLVNNINPKVAIPTHYGSVVGTIEDADDFGKLVNKNIKVKKYF